MLLRHIVTQALYIRAPWDDPVLFHCLGATFRGMCQVQSITRGLSVQCFTSSHRNQGQCSVSCHATCHLVSHRPPALKELICMCISCGDHEPQHRLPNINRPRRQSLAAICQVLDLPWSQIASRKETASDVLSLKPKPSIE